MSVKEVFPSLSDATTRTDRCVRYNRSPDSFQSAFITRFIQKQCVRSYDGGGRKLNLSQELKPHLHRAHLK